MKKLEDILKGIVTLQKTGPENPDIRSICFDSRKVKPEDVFIAVKGTRSDGHDFISQALSDGAVCVICETLPGDPAGDVSFVQVRDSAEALGIAASNYFDRPAEKLRVVGVTGTNGKTTVASLLCQLFEEAGHVSGLLSTVHNRVGKKVLEATHTTPDALQLHSLLAGMVTSGCEYCFMEVSSHAIHQKRIAGIQFSGGIFTNVSHEHLDYHKTFREYIQAKKAFFDKLPGGAFALVNSDDRNGKVMLQNCSATPATYALKSMADYKGRILENHLDGMHLILDGSELWTRFAGDFNAGNLLAVYAAARILGMEKEQALTLLSKLVPVKGRFESLESGSGVTAIVDFAHTPDALKNVLSAIQKIRNGSRKLITVVGAGGNRDSSKRPLMGKVAAELSHRVILTSDNPRFEKPDDIIRQMMDGVPEQYRKQVLSIPDRKEAIKTAIMLSSRGDIILVAGKGHETYQEIEGKKHHFDDREIIEDLFAKT